MLILKQNNPNSVPTPGAGKGTVFLNSSDQLSVKTSANVVNVVSTVPGSNTQIAFNDAGALGANANLTFDKANSQLTVLGNAVVSGIKTDNYMYANGAPFTGGGGNGTPGGTNTQVQFNDAGNFGGTAGLTFDKTTNAFSVAGNLTAANISGGNAVSANYFLGDGGLLTNISTTGGTSITNGNSSVNVLANGNVTTSVNGVSNVQVVTSTGVTYTGNLLPSANVTYSLGSPTNAWKDLYLAGNTLYIADETMNVNATSGVWGFSSNGGYVTLGADSNLANSVTSNYFIGDGGLLTNISTASGTSINNGNSNVAIPVANGNVTVNVAGNSNVVVISGTGINVAGYANVTGNLETSNLYVSGTANIGGAIGGNISGANVISANTINAAVTLNTVNAVISGNLTVSGNTTYVNVTNLNVQDPLISLGGGANGDPLSTNDGKDRGTLLEYYTTAPVTAFMGWDNSNAEFALGSNVSVSNEVVTFNTFGNLRTGNANIITNLTVGGNFITAGGSGGNISGANNISANTFTGTLTTAAQPNITSVGTLSSLTVTGNITAGNISANISGNGSALSSLTFGNITTLSTAGITTDEIYLQAGTRLDVTANGTSGYVFDQYGAGNNPVLYVMSGQTLAFNLSTAGHPFLIQTSAGSNYSTGLSHVATTGTVLTGASAQGQVAGTLYWKVPYGITGNYKYQCSIHGGMNGNIVVTDANISNVAGGSTTSIINGNSNVVVAANGNVTTSVAGNANILTVTGTGIVVEGSANANIVAANTVNVATALNINGNTTFGSGTGGNITGANVITANTVNVATSLTFGNGTGGNISNANVISANTLTALVTANLGAVGNVTITGGSNGNVLTTYGNGVLYWGSAGTGSASNISNGNSNVNAGTANGNITVSVAGNSNIAVFTGTGINVAGYVNATGNMTAGNFTVGAGSGGNITGANLIEANTVNVATAINITGTVTWGSGSGGNLTGANLISGNTVNVATALNVAGTSNLGPIANVTITGGSNGNVLTTYGNGTLYWGAAGSGSSSNISNGNSNVNAGTANGNITVSVAGNSNIAVFTGTGVNIAGTLNATGNVTAGNVSGGNVVTANYLTGTLTTASQPNITSIGTLSSLTATGNITAGNLIGSHANGNSNVNIPAANGNVNISAAGNANVLVVTGTGVNVAGTLNTTGNANLANLVVVGTANLGGGSGGTLSGANLISANYVNVAVDLTVSGNANIGSGAGGSITGANLLSANYVNVATQLTVAGNLTTSGVSGNISGANVISANTINVANDAVITGNLTVNGNLIYVNVDNLSVEDPIINLQTGPNGAAPSSNSGKDVGSALNYYDTQARVAFMGWDVSNAEFGFGSVTTITNEVVTFTDYGNVRANYFIGNGSLLTGISTSSANISNGTSNVNIATSGGNVTVGVAGNANILTVTGTGIVVSGTANLGNVGNVKITGGTANYFLQTDGAGNLTWAEASAPTGTSTATTDSFTGNGVANSFTLTVTPASKDWTTVNYNGVILLKSDYTLAGNVVSFTDAPANGAKLEVTTLSVSGSGGITTGKAIAMSIVFGG